MTMATRARSFRTVSLVLLCVFTATPTFAHPPWAPFDDTRFAPITRFGPSIGIETVARGDATNSLTSPLKVVSAPGLPNHVFIVDQPGIIWAVNLTTGVRTKFLDARALVIPLGVCGPDTFDERGLLGLAFHPRYEQNGKIYTYTSELATGIATIPKATAFDPDHQNVVSEWIVANPANPTAPVIGPRRELLRVDWPQFNHDGGDLAFGPDRKLYITMGDGGGADDSDGQAFALARPKHPQTPTCSLVAPITGHQGNGNAQKLNTALGKMHRIDVDGTPTPGKQYRVPPDNPFVNTPGAVPEIWAFGLRNPYRFSFDRKTGVLLAGDVGQNDIEEVDKIVRGGNYGWNCKEGTLFFHINGLADGFASPDPDPSRPDCKHKTFIDPIAQYDTHHEGHSVIGGYVYRGSALPGLRGRYVFADFSLLFKFPRGPHDYGRLFVMQADDEMEGLREISEMLVLPGGSISLAVLGSGEDTAGEHYVTGNVFGVPFGNSGVVVRIVPAPEAD
jgi:glucose/arabinose dehydrogenase